MKQNTNILKGSETPVSPQEKKILGNETPAANSATTRNGLHTPGPWKWWDKASGRPKNYDLAYLFVGETDQSGKRILSLYGGEGYQALGNTSEDKANARLIVAAPELLFALQNLVPDFESGYIANPSVRADQRRDKHLKIIKAAIAKAGGK